MDDLKQLRLVPTGSGDAVRLETKSNKFIDTFGNFICSLILFTFGRIQRYLHVADGYVYLFFDIDRMYF